MPVSLSGPGCGARLTAPESAAADRAEGYRVFLPGRGSTSSNWRRRGRPRTPRPSRRSASRSSSC